MVEIVVEITGMILIEDAVGNPEEVIQVRLVAEARAVPETRRKAGIEGAQGDR